jgi:hypothetical protein
MRARSFLSFARGITLLCSLLMFALAPLRATTITLDTVSVGTGWADADGTQHQFYGYGSTFAQLPEVVTQPSGAVIHSATICQDGVTGCPSGGESGTGLLNIRFTDVDITCGPDSDCGAFGIGYSFSGTLTGSAVFDFVLRDVVLTLPPDTFISGNLSLDLEVDGVITNQFLGFDSLGGTTFGPTAPILLTGDGTAFTGFGTLILAGLPAGSEIQITNSGEFEFNAVPEPVLAFPVLTALAVMYSYRRRAAQI